jgi:rod shape-determining protein MreC
MYRKDITTERKTFILVTVLFLNLILISTNVVLKNRKSLFQNIVGFIVSPFQLGFQETVDFISRKLEHYVFLKNVHRKYLEIKKQQNKLKVENYLLRKKIEDEAFFSGLKHIGEAFIQADVISIDRDFPLSSVLLNKGTRNGVKKGMTVLNGNAEVVGKTVDPISLFSARVRLITSSIDGVGAYIKKNKLEGFLKGNNTTICLFKYLVENKPVSVGDEIITSGTDQIFPPYLPIGRVVKIEKEYLIQEVFVKPYFVEKSLKKLIILKNKPE